MKQKIFAFLVMVAVLIAVAVSPSLADDKLPLDNQTGYYAGVEASTNYMHIETEPSVNTTYTVAMPMALATAGYGTEVYLLGILGGAGAPSVRRAFDQFGDANDTVPVFGAVAKVAPVKVGPVKLGIVADVKYVGSASDSARGSFGIYPMDAKLSYGPMWLWSAGAIAQYQTKHITVYGGEKYEDIAYAHATMCASVTTGHMTHANQMDVKFKQVDNFATVAGLVFTPIDKVNVTLQGRYTKGTPMSATANVEYRF